MAGHPCYRVQAHVQVGWHRWKTDVQKSQTKKRFIAFKNWKYYLLANWGELPKKALHTKESSKISVYKNH